MPLIKLILGCHAHQPVGNFDFVLEQAYHQSYRPFLEVLQRFPQVKCTLHFTGPLFDWFQEHQPQFLEDLACLSRAGQVEIMGGAYYEPLICAIPERDAIAQIKRMNRFCKKHFGQTPGGMWLTERVWEPHMAHTLARGGLKYTALDDTHFMNSGLRPEDLYGYYMTEDNGSAIAIFPIQEKLRYIVPFHPVEETITYLRELAEGGENRVVVLHDDYEKFGAWPGTYHSVYEEGWLEQFFGALTDNQDWLQTATYAEVLAAQPALGRTYIPCASYKEMMVWSLTTPQQKNFHALERELKEDPERYERFKPFLKGSFWRCFLAKYPESNNLHKRMLRVSNRLRRLKKVHKKSKQLAAAENLLHQAQCNCAYWHGVFGGLYLNHLRTAIYQKCIEADVILDAVEKRKGIQIECSDVDGDGQDEVVLENSQVALFLKPQDNGVIYEFDYKPGAFNFFNTLARREESYHAQLTAGADRQGERDEGKLSIHDIVRTKEEGLDKYLVYDHCRRVGLRERFFTEMPTVESFAANGGGRAEFPVGVFSVETRKDGVMLESPVLSLPDQEGSLRIQKTVRLTKDSAHVGIQYDVENLGESVLVFNFGVEFGVNLLAGDAPDRYFRSDDQELNRPQLNRNMRLDHCYHLALTDEWQWLEFGLRLETPANIYTMPIETVSQSEDGQERVYQGSVIMPCWPVRLAQGERQTFHMTLEPASNLD